MAPCACKRGACDVCGAACRRCGCACDGTPPHIALARKRGHRGRGRGTRCSTREAKAKHPAPERKRQRGDRVAVSIDSVGDVWNVFGFTESARKKLPSAENRQKGTCPDTTQWSTLVRTVQRAAVRVAEILFPGGTGKLLTAVGAKLTNADLHTDDGDTCRGINSSTELKKLSTAAIAVLNNSSRGSLPRRVARAILVKGLSSKFRKHLRRTDGVNLSGSFFQDHGYKDYRDLVHGNGLSKRKESCTQGGEVPLPDHNAPIGATSKRGRKSVLSNELISFIEHLVDQQSDIKPKAALQLVKEHFTTLPEEATDSRIKTKVSSTKGARKEKHCDYNSCASPPVVN